MLNRIVREYGLGGQHLRQATQATHERDFAGCAVFVRLPATEFGQWTTVGDPRKPGSMEPCASGMARN